MGKKSQSKHKNIKKPNHKREQPQARKLPMPKTTQQYNETFTKESKDIKNKQKRNEVVVKRRAIKNQIKMRERKQRQQLPASERQQPQTIEDKQIGGEEFEDEYSEADFDEFNKILKEDFPVKILVTTCIKPPKKIYNFLREIMMVFHNIYFYPRHRMTLEEIYEHAQKLNYTHVMVLRYSNGWEMLIRHLEGLLAVFRVTSVEEQKKIEHHGVCTDNIPELILKNFDTKVGLKIGRLLASLFPQNPQFRGRRVVTFHNQRDFIFFRHHRYIFSDEFDQVHLQEIGPRFTMRLKKLYKGTAESVEGIQFQAKDNMYVDRAATYL